MRAVLARRLLLVLVSCVLVALLGLVALRSVLHSDLVRERVRQKASEILSSRLGEVRIGERFAAGWHGQVVLGPIDVLASAPELPPVVHLDSATVQVRLWPLLSGHVEPKRVRLAGVRIEAGADAAELRALARRMEEKRSASIQSGSDRTQVPLPEVILEDVHLALSHHAHQLVLGPASGRLHVTRAEGVTDVALQLAFADAGSLDLSLQRDADKQVSAKLVVDQLGLAQLASQLALPVHVEAGTLSGELRLPDRHQLEVDLQVRDLSVSAARLAADPVGPLHLGVRGELQWDEHTKEAQAKAIRIALGERGEAAFVVDGTLELAGERRFSTTVRTDALTYRALAQALPPALAPGENAEALDGPLGLQVSVSGPLAHRDAWELAVKLDMAPLKKAGRAHPPFELGSTFTYRPLTPEGRGRPIVVGPSNPDFVPFSDVPPVLVRAVLLSEDAGFFGHPGFDFESLRDNLFAPEQPGAVVRGGSTISQQLTKNLFLSREKTYARKLREALLTLALEASYPKERLLEIYLNVIEWGPGLYGLSEAAWHYFGTDPRRLSVKQAVFLATIIPNPVKYHVYCSRGALTDTWQQRIDYLLTKMHGTGDLTDEQFAQATSEQLVFVHGGVARQ